MNNVKTILFDLDGTLLDSAPDLIAAINKMLLHRDLEPLPLDETFMQSVNGGKKAMLFQAFQVTNDDPRFASLEAEFEQNYSVAPSLYTKPFAGILPMLAELDALELPWGIVTNKITRFTLAILEQQQLLQRAAVVVCGDSVAHSKPHPQPLLHACHQLGISPLQCLYVGDAETDMLAAQRAAMQGAVALFGYGARKQNARTWPASVYLEQPQDLTAWLKSTEPSLP